MEKLSNVHDFDTEYDMIENESKIENKMTTAVYKDCLEKKHLEKPFHIFLSSIALHEPKQLEFDSCFESNNNKAIASDWNIVRDDILQAFVKVIDDQSPAFKNEFYKLVAKKMTDEKRRKNTSISR